MRRFWDRPLGSKLIVILTIVFLIEMLAPWQRVCQVTSSNSDPRICGWVTGYSGWGLWAALFAVALLVWELLPILVPGFSMRGWSTALVTAALGICLAVTTLIKLIDDNAFQTAWAWAGLAIALAIMLTAILRVRFRWRNRGADGVEGTAVAGGDSATPV